VTDVLIYADTVRSPELRHEVPRLVPDAFLYVERNGDRHVVISALEIPVLSHLSGLELHPTEEFGVDELRRSGTPATELGDEIALRAVQALGVERAIVPAGFPVLLADRLRAAGVELTPDREPSIGDAARSRPPSSRGSGAPRPPRTRRWARRAG
jgi:Xaa-Pro aminopeptidase